MTALGEPTSSEKKSPLKKKNESEEKVGPLMRKHEKGTRGFPFGFKGREPAMSRGEK